MSRSRTTKINVFFGITFVIINLVKNIVLVPFYLQFVDLEQYGAWLATGGILAQLFITDFGLSTLIIQKSARYYNKKDEELGKIILSGVTASLFIVSILTCFLIYVSLPVTSLVVADASLKKLVNDCLQLAIAANAIAIFGLIFNGLHKSVQKPVTAGSIELVSEIIGITSVIYLFLNGSGLYSIPLSLLIRNVIFFFLSLLSFVFVASGLSIRYGKPAWADIRMMFADSGHLTLNTFAMRLTRRADVFFVGAILGAEKAGIYSISIRAFEMVNLFISQFGKGAMPSLSSLFGAAAPHRLKDVGLKYYSFVTMVSLVLFCGVILFNDSFIRLWVGQEYFAGQLFVLLAGIAFFIQAMASIAYDFLLAKGEFRFISRVFVLLSVVYLLLVLNLLQQGLLLAPAIQILVNVIAIIFFWKRFVNELVLSKQDVKNMIGLLLKSGLPVLLLYGFFVHGGTALTNWYAFTGTIIAYLCAMSLYVFLVNRRIAQGVLNELLQRQP